MSFIPRISVYNTCHRNFDIPSNFIKIGTDCVSEPPEKSFIPNDYLKDFIDNGSTTLNELNKSIKSNKVATEISNTDTTEKSKPNLTECSAKIISSETIVPKRKKAKKGKLTSVKNDLTKKCF